jgi:hypothetical protein
MSVVVRRRRRRASRADVFASLAAHPGYRLKILYLMLGASKHRETN